MKKIIILGLVLFLFAGCRKMCCTNYYTHIFLKYQNSNGDDLLDSRTQNAIKEQDIEVYVLRKGERVRLFNAMLDAKKNVKIYGSSTEKYVMQFYFDSTKESFVGKQVTMFIKYKDGSDDKLVGEFNDNEGANILLQRVWINNVAINLSQSPSEAFIIKK